MKHKLIFFYVTLLLSLSITAQVNSNSKLKNMSSITPKGNPAPKDYFTGTVWVNMVVAPQDDLNSVIGKVTFEAKARTNWHSHPKGQVLIVTEGTGYYQEKGKPIQLIKKGDVIKIMPNTLHWHGASHARAMTHTAIVADVSKESTHWMQAVTDIEYDSYKTESSSLDLSVKITPAALRNHEELFPDYESKVSATDPELIALFDNFAFDEVISHDKLDVKTRVMMILGSTIASQALTEYKMMVGGALNVGVSPVEIKEVLYQSVPYVGISKVIDFILATNEIFESRGIGLPLEKQGTTMPENRHEKGLAVQKSIFGERIDQMYTNAPKDMLHIQNYLSANCFGDYYTRGGLDIKTRELLTYCMLISLCGTESQVKGHVQGNINVGNSREVLIDVTTQLLPYIGYPRTLNAMGCINEIAPE